MAWNPVMHFLEFDLNMTSGICEGWRSKRRDTSIDMIQHLINILFRSLRASSSWRDWNGWTWAATRSTRSTLPLTLGQTLRRLFFHEIRYINLHTRIAPICTPRILPYIQGLLSFAHHHHWRKPWEANSLAQQDIVWQLVFTWARWK